jgi:hypothetical protein
VDDIGLPSNLPQEPPPPIHRVREKSKVRQSERAFLRRRGISLRRRSHSEKLSKALVVGAVLVFIPLVISWGWLWDPEMPWINMGRSKLVFPIVLAAALVVWVLCGTNLYGVLSARQQEQERAAQKREQGEDEQR